MKSLITVMMIFSLPSWSTVTVGVHNCPVQFEGRVKQIIEPIGPSDIFSMNKVVFENHRTLKGEAHDQIQLDILQNGPFTVEAEKEYRVQLREGKLCWMEEI